MSPKFSELDGEHRYGKDAMAGDLAESKVAEFMASIGKPVADFGPRRVDTSRAQHTTWPDVVRHAPDFLGFGRFIEAQGSGGAYVVFKKAKLEALTFWDTLMPVWFGLYDSDSDVVILCDLPSVLWAINHERAKPIVLDADSKFPKEAWEVPLDVLLERRFYDALEARRVHDGKRKRKPQGSAS